MRNSNKLKLLVALPTAALLALPGEAKPVMPQDATMLTPAIVAVPAQATFGLLLDPHAAPVLHIDLPAAIWAF